ncbi:aminopeptidase [Coprinopsis marcescibilis]|uniref:Peptide hydrolase n=1 Tax=Coprinopsis marcescibilis TaxID=230819 RepID=A0A5C3KZ69_COPMA|nr:aminopeptidase [Coprinopsis marcescibilis]
MMFRQLLAFVALVVASVNGAISREELESHSSKGLRLISLEEGADPVWVTEEEKLKLMIDDTNFFDVTEFYSPEEEAIKETSRRIPTESSVRYNPVARRATIPELLAQVSQSQSQAYMTQLTSYHTRYYRTETGAASARWIRDTAAALATRFPASGASAALFTNSFVQSSVIAKIPGSNPSAPRVILGAHLDTINNGNPTGGRAPGADDDGSGCVNLLEAFRVLVTAGYKPTATVEFHWYGGEEAGLLGSQAIARSYKSSNVPVKAMINFDMTATLKSGARQIISLIPDYTNAALNQVIGRVVDTYLSVPWVLGDRCNYACSDHAAWHNQGFPAAYAFESLDKDMSTVFHTTSDTATVTGFSWNHLLQFTRLAIAAAYELSV